MKIGEKAITKSLVISGNQHYLVAKKISTIPEIKMTEIGKGNFTINIKKPINHYPFFKIDESYELKVDGAKVTLTSFNEYGALHGLETMRQLLIDFDGKLPKLFIKDHPRFPWRGLLIDVARQWVSLETLKQQIDLMSKLKFNVLHLHLSDDQAFRVESKIFPNLHKNNNDKNFYNQQQMRDLVVYALERGIRTVPEFDVPGHVSAMVAAYPELATLKELSKPSENFGPHDSALNPIKEGTYTFLEKLFSEMSTLFPDEFFHVGGDEVSGKHWMNDPEIQKYMADNKIKNVVELQFIFTKKIESIVKKINRKMLAWDEVLNEDKDINAAIQIWRGPKFAKMALARKIPIIMSYGFYLDLQLSSETHYNADPSRDLALKNPDLLWGGEACLWSERVNEKNVAMRIWPRAMAVAERLWSNKKVTDVRDFYDRQIGLARNFHLFETLIVDQILIEAPKMKVSPETLGEFFSWIEAGKFYSQHRYRKWKATTVQDLWVDILPSESLKETMLVWTFRDWQKKNSPEKLKLLNDTFESLIVLSESLRPLQAADFKEKEDLVSLAKDLGSLGRIGKEAILYLSGLESPASLWFMEMHTKLTMMGQLRGGMQPAPYALISEIVFLVKQKYNLASR
jgi:hexosaminidase